MGMCHGTLKKDEVGKGKLPPETPGPVRPAPVKVKVPTGAALLEASKANKDLGIVAFMIGAVSAIAIGNASLSALSEDSRSVAAICTHLENLLVASAPTVHVTDDALQQIIGALEDVMIVLNRHSRLIFDAQGPGQLALDTLDSFTRFRRSIAAAARALPAAAQCAADIALISSQKFIQSDEAARRVRQMGGAAAVDQDEDESAREEILKILCETVLSFPLRDPRAAAQHAVKKHLGADAMRGWREAAEAAPPSQEAARRLQRQGAVLSHQVEAIKSLVLQQEIQLKEIMKVFPVSVLEGERDDGVRQSGIFHMPVTPRLEELLRRALDELDVPVAFITAIEALTYKLIVGSLSLSKLGRGAAGQDIMIAKEVVGPRRMSVCQHCVCRAPHVAPGEPIHLTSDTVRSSLAADDLHKSLAASDPVVAQFIEFQQLVGAALSDGGAMPSLPGGASGESFKYVMVVTEEGLNATKSGLCYTGFPLFYKGTPIAQFSCLHYGGEWDAARLAEGKALAAEILKEVNKLLDKAG